MTSRLNVSIKADTQALKDVQKGLSKAGYVKVGVLGNEASRGEEGINNAELGAVQEFGSASKNIPPRSFLRAPLEGDKKQIIKALQSKAVKKAIEEGNAEAALELVGIAAEGVVDEAFATSGGGTWAANKPSTVRKKGSSRPLVDTGELRRSITSEVISGEKT